MGKTETIKERAIYVYLPSHDMVERWKKLAKKQGTSISKFVIEHVESSIRAEEGLKAGFEARAELLKRIQELEDEVTRLRKENRMFRLAAEKLEEELRAYRAEPFKERERLGLRGFEKNLIKLLKTKGKVRGEDLPENLGIDPMDRELTEAVYNQLRVLEAYGLVQATMDGWRWLK
jgi:regulator of replication initiation timing